MGKSAKAPTRGREEKVNMDTEKRKELLHELEMRHQFGASQSDLLVKDEDVRRLKLRILMLRDENTTLREEITQNTELNAELAEQYSDLSAQLEAKIEVVRSQEKQLRKQEREFSNLQAELQTMNNITQDSTTILAEKLALNRELAVLKPELEHLRSQLAHQQTTLGENLALERQVNTLEVELANEKKATQRAMKKRESNDRVEDELRQKLRETEKQLNTEKAQRERLEDQLAQEKKTHQLALQDQDSTRELESDLRKKLQETQRQLREEKEDKERLEEELQVEKRLAKKAQKKRASTAADDRDGLQAKLQEIEAKMAAGHEELQKVRKQGQDAIAEAESHNDSLEKKLEKMKTKLRETMDQLKQCQADLRKAQQPKPLISEEVAKKIGGRQATKKRKADEIVTDGFSNITIATPSADDRPHRGAKSLSKKRQIEPTMVGEKSTFSITPFLNRSNNNKDTTEDTENPDESVLEDTFCGSAEKSDKGRIVEAVTTTSVPVAASDDSRASSVPSEPSGTVLTAVAQPQVQEKPDAQEKKPRGRPKKVLGEAPSAKKNAQSALRATLKRKTPKVNSNTLEKVTEVNEAPANEVNDKAQMVKLDSTLPQDESTTSANASKGEEPKKKKRKVLGSAKTLFEEESNETPPPPSKAGKTGKKAPLGGTRNAFAKRTFSPLKKHRRGVGASFLA